MKVSFYSAFSFFLMSFFVYGCSGDKIKQAVKNMVADEQSDEESQISNNNEDRNMTDWEKLVMKDVSEGNTGEVTYTIPLPESWSVHTEPGASHFITGPGNLTIKGGGTELYQYTPDPYFRDLYTSTGAEMHPIPNTEQLFQNYIIPQLKEQGITFVDYEELPDVAVPSKWYAEQLFNPHGFKKLSYSYGINVKNPEGKDAYIITTFNVSEDQMLSTWYLMSYYINADPKTLNMAKKTFAFGLGNIRFNLEPIMRYNQAEAQKHNQSWAAFNSRMKSNQIAFEQRQRNHINMVNGVNDALMAGYNSSNATNERIHNRTIDAIREEDNVYNPSTGEMHKVEQGYNQYWMNSDGVYIATESPTYDPNLDENMNNMTWDQLQKAGN